MNSTLAHTCARVTACAALAAALVTQPAQGQVWTDWTGLVYNAVLGSGTGSLTVGSDVIAVEYAGQVAAPSQTTCGTAWFGSPAYHAYSGTVTPPPPCDMIAITGASAAPSLHTLIFSAPVVDPFFAIVSMGQSGIPVQYAFDAPFTIIDQGAGFWGNGPLTDLGGNVLEGREGHGIIRFSGTYTSLSWNASPTEYWHGFTVGAVGTSVTPEPMSLALLGTGLIGVAVVARRRRRVQV